MTANVIRTCSLALLAMGALSSATQAQQFNVDFDSSFPTQGPTPSTYPAAGTAGTWNQITGGTTGPFNLVDKSGASTGVTLSLSSGVISSLEFANASITGDHALLMNDIVYDGLGPALFTFSGMADGVYTVYTYAMAPDNKTGFISGVDVSGSTDGLQNVGGSLWTGGHAPGVSYAKHTATVSGGTLVVTVTEVLTFMSINGIQIEGGTSPGDPYCFGDSTGSPCPCLAFGAPGAGCLNTSGAGAVLVGTGVPNTTADTLTLSATGCPPLKPGLFFQGNNMLANPVGDGLLCTNALLRYAVNSTDAAGNVSQTGFGANAATGVTLNYQYWFRDPANPCGGGFNFTNGWVVTWL